MTAKPFKANSTVTCSHPLIKPPAKSTPSSISVGTLRVWYNLADRMCMLITSDLCTVYEAIEGVGCYKLCGDTNTKSRDLHTTPLLARSYNFLGRKLDLARLPTDLADEERSENNGVTLKLIRDTIDFWRKSYDWRHDEDLLNKLPQYKCPVA